MSNRSNITFISPNNIVERKRQKNRRNIFLSVLGLSSLSVAVSLPLGFLTNFIAPPASKPITTPYDPNTVLSKTNVDFEAYYVFGWKLLTLSTILVDVNLERDSLVPEKQINLQSLANLGIVPKNDKWKSWAWVRSVPLEGSGNSFRMLILESVGATTPFSYDVSIPTGAITPSTFYNTNYRLAIETSFYAYKPTTLTTLSDFYLTYLKNSNDPLSSITIDNLEKIGIVPILDEYKTWESITLFPIDGKTIQVSIRKSAVGQASTYAITGFTTSTFYNANSNPILTNADFVSYIPNSFSQTSLINLNKEFTKNSFNPATKINFSNLETIGIVPLNNNYKSWESISIYPVSGNEVKCIVRISTTAPAIEYNIVGVKPSLFYDINTTPLYNSSPDFIMYVPYAWRNIFPVEATFTFTSTSTNPQTKINLETLEKIGIVPKNLDYKNWSSIAITPISSGTCNIVIKKNTDLTVVANFDANCFKTSGLYNPSVVIYSSATGPFNFKWYKPTSWNGKTPKEISVSFTSSNMTLENLESVGIVPLNEQYKQWSSILKSDIFYGLQGKFSITMISSAPQASPLTFELTGYRQSTLYNPANIISQYPNASNPDFIQFAPNSFSQTTQEYIDSLRLIVWVNRQISLANLETIGIVPINDNYLGWTKVEFSRTADSSSMVYFSVYNNPSNPQSYIELGYHYSIRVGI